MRGTSFRFLCLLTLVTSEISQANCYRYSLGGGSAGGARTTPTIAWTDPQIIAGRTPVKAVHMNELRQDINNKRLACGLAQANWSEPIVAKITPIKAIHVLELRAAIPDLLSKDAALKNLPQPYPSVYSAATLVPEISIRKLVDIQEIRNILGSITCPSGGGPLLIPQQSNSFGGVLTKYNSGTATLDSAIYTDFGNWLTAQYATMGVALTVPDLISLQPQQELVTTNCQNTSNGSKSVDYNFHGMIVTVVVFWQGTEQVLQPGTNAVCNVSISGTLNGSLNGVTCN